MLSLLTTCLYITSFEWHNRLSQRLSRPGLPQPLLDMIILIREGNFIKQKRDKHCVIYAIYIV